MPKSKLAATLILIGLVMACGHLEQLDHDNAVKPLPKAIDPEMVERIRHTNKAWYPVDIKEIATN